jgi:thioredoxin-like negative regulator of GroEL
MKVISTYFLLLFIFPVYTLSQIDEAAKEKQRRKTMVIERILSDVPNLKLNENRALVYAKVGNLIWQFDAKQARALFQNAVGELLNAQTLAEADRKNIGYQNDLLTGQTTRPQILNAVASRDAELALEYLYKTRPAKISQVMSASSGKKSKISNQHSNYGYLIQNEINLEQSFMRLAADQNPERAIKLLKESLKKGLSNETLNLLKKLCEKDAASADQLAREIVGKIIQSGFDAENQANYQNTNIATSFLTEFIREKSPTEKFIKFENSQMQNLADRLIAYFFQQNARYGNYSAYSILPIAEKLAPASVAKIKQAGKNNSRRGLNFYDDPEINKLLNDADTTTEELLSKAENFPVESRRRIYQTAANKLVQNGDVSRAAEILNDNFSDDALEDALRNLNGQYSYHLISAGKFEQAERVIDEMPENTRLNSLVNLANAIYQKNPADNKSYAAAVLGKARALISEQPEDNGEMSGLMQIISTYSAIEPVEAFRLYESLIPQMNELSDAAVKINGFNRSSNVKQGEFVISSSGNSLNFLGADFSVLGKLAANDFDRTLNLINGFTRRETVISLQLQLLENGLN